jgi:ABC-type Mn2+/Zn2+ transport system ATPase subunit
MGMTQQGKRHRIRRVMVTEGLLKGQTAELPDGLGCIIGGRGAGKSTLLELVRYALDAFAGCSDEDRQRIGSLVRDNLGAGRVVLTVETAEGLEYNVSRAVDEPPVVLTPDGEPTDIRFSAADLLRASVYSQNQIENIASDPVSQLALIDGFDRDNIKHLSEQPVPLEKDLKHEVTEIMSISDEIAQLEQNVNTLPVVEQKLKALSRGGTKVALAVNEAYKNKAARERESLAIQQASEILGTTAGKLSELAGTVTTEIKPLLEKELTGPNGKFLKEALDTLIECGQHLDKSLTADLQDIKQHQASLARIAKKLQLEHDRQELAFHQLIEKQNMAEKEAGERVSWEKKHSELVNQKQKLETLQNRLRVLQEHRGQKLGQVKKLRHERFLLRKAVVDRINQQLTSHRVRVRIEENGNREPLRRLLEESLRKSEKQIQHRIVSAKLADRMQPSEIAETVVSGNENKLAELAELNANQAKVVIATLAGSKELLDMESLEMLDRPRIELLHGKAYKDSLKLSTGQKCTAVLPILLLESAHPLLIDQPEDNLDNGFIYETVVKSLQQIKQHRQLLFVTHNANIPVLGDADKIFVLECDGERAGIVRQGSVYDCKEDILSLLEGGEEAFAERGRRYGEHDGSEK